MAQSTKSKQCYFLVWRVRKDQEWDISRTKPTGGLVVLATREVEGHRIADWRVVRDVANQRYHCAPGEQLLIAEVFRLNEQIKAFAMHRKWDLDMREFMQLMRAA